MRISMINNESLLSLDMSHAIFGRYTKKLITDLKFKFNWTAYIFLCQIWQPYYFMKV